MNIAQNPLGVLLGFGLLALLGNSVLANEPDTTTKNASVHSGSKEQMGCHDQHFDQADGGTAYRPRSVSQSGSGMGRICE